MGRKTAASAIARISSRGILTRSSYKSGTTTALATVSNYPFGYFCSTFVTLIEKPRSDFSYLHDLDGALSLFRDMVRMRPQTSVADFTKLLNSVVKMKHYVAALHLFDEMREWGVPVNVWTMNIVINCYCHLNRVDFGFAILGSLFKRGYEPTTSTFTTLLKGLFLEEKVAEGEKLFKKLLREKCCDLNEVMFLTVINGLCKAGNACKAHDLLRSLEKRNYKLDVYCYNTVIDSFCKDGRFHDASMLASKMIEKGVLPDDVTYCSMIQGLCNFGRWKEAKDLLKQMQAQQVTPSLLTYNILLNGLSRARQADEAFAILSMMEVNGVNPNIVTYNILIKCLCENGKVDVARDLFKELPSKGLPPDVKTFTIIISALCQKKLMKEAKDLLTNMQRRGCTPDSRIYNVLVQGFLKRNEYVEALLLLEEMTRRGFSPDPITGSMLCKIS